MTTNQPKQNNGTTCLDCGHYNTPVEYPSGHESPPYSCEQCGNMLPRHENLCLCDTCRADKIAQMDAARNLEKVARKASGFKEARQ